MQFAIFVAKEKCMRGRKPQSLPAPNAYAMIPQFMYALLGNGTISPSAFALWATIRLFARDQERKTFSPTPVALTTLQLAQFTGLCVAQVKNLLVELENAQVLERQTHGTIRKLQLRAPVIMGQWISRLVDYPANPQEEDLALSTELEATPPPESLSPEGGVRGTQYRLTHQPVNQLAANAVALNSSDADANYGLTDQPANHLTANWLASNQLAVNQLAANQLAANTVALNRAAMVALLRERGAFPRVAETIADTLIAAGITDLTEVRDLVNTVFQQVLAEGAKEHQVIGRAIARLRNGDWNMAAIQEQIMAEANAARYARYNTALPDAHADNVRTQSVNTPAAGNSKGLTRVAEAEGLWQQTLTAIRVNTTADIYNTWLRQSRGAGYNGDGKTLVIETHTPAGVEILGGQLLPLVQRGLKEVAGDEVPVRFVVAAGSS